MLTVELKDKGITLGIPEEYIGEDGQPTEEAVRAIQAQFYKQEPVEPEPEKAQPAPETPGRLKPPGERVGEFVANHSRKFVADGLGTAQGMIRALDWVADSEQAKKAADYIEGLREKIEPEEDLGFAGMVTGGFASALTFWIPGMGIAGAATKLASIANRQG